LSYLYRFQCRELSTKHCGQLPYCQTCKTPQSMASETTYGFLMGARKSLPSKTSVKRWCLPRRRWIGERTREHVREYGKELHSGKMQRKLTECPENYCDAHCLSPCNMCEPDSTRYQRIHKRTWYAALSYQYEALPTSLGYVRPWMVRYLRMDDEMDAVELRLIRARADCASPSS
jgi:hypothetical protein